MSKPSLAVTRVRHALKRRLARVAKVQALTPHLVRVTFQGPDFTDFDSQSFDDHVKVMFPPEGVAQPWRPASGPDGVIFPDGMSPIMRDYTPRRQDRAAGELDIEFALHEAGPATQWAATAAVGQYLVIGGPRGSMIIPPHFDWHLLIGDETALPAVARRLEELPSGSTAIVLLEVSDASARIEFSTPAKLEVTWCHRESAPVGEALLAALTRLPALPEGEGYAWAATESSVVRRVREHLSQVRHIDKSRIRAAAYWKKGQEAVHEVVDD